MASILERKTEINLCYLTPDKLKDFYDFEIYVNAGQKSLEEVTKRFKTLVLDSPLLQDRFKPNVLIACNGENKIIGKLVCSPCEFYFKGDKKIGFYYFDFFVQEEYRNKGIGSSLIETALSNFKPAFIHPASDSSMKIALSFKFKPIGCLRKFVWLKNIGSLFKTLDYCLLKSGKSLNLDNKLQFPLNLTIERSNFVLTKCPEDWDDYLFSNNTLEFSRTYENLKWHISRRPDINYFYLCRDLDIPIYFVIRKSFWRGLNVLEVVDYKTSINSSKGFQILLLALKELVKKYDFDGIIIMSSHKFFDSKLKKNLFFMGGSPMHILMNADIESSQKESKDRDFVYATLRDLQ